MKSPFPGMDPYLERHWGDLHQCMLTDLCDRLQSVLPGDLRARMQERVYITPAEPLLIHLAIETVTEGYIEVIDVKSGHHVVTSIEILSPTNKRRGEGQQLYLKKREDRKRARVNTVEIDLLRGGDRILMLSSEQIPPSQSTPYQVCVWRAALLDLITVYKIPLRKRLPVISVPLRLADSNVPLDLQAILEQCYRNGGYDDIDYTRDPDPPLRGDDAIWADALLRKHGRR